MALEEITTYKWIIEGSGPVSYTHLTIHLTMRPRVSDIRYNGVKKSEREDLESRIGMIKGGPVSYTHLSQRYRGCRSFRET